jgi:hypothetical protein
MPVPETRVFFEGGIGIVTSLLTGQSQQLVAGQNAVVNPAGMVSPPAITPAGQRLGPGVPMPMGQPVSGYMSKPPLPPLPPPMPGQGPLGPKPPLIDPSLLPPLPPFEQVFKPLDQNVLAQIPFVKVNSLYPITAANLDLTLKTDGTWSAGMRGDFVLSVPYGPWNLQFENAAYDSIQFNNIQAPLVPNSSGTFSKTPPATGFSFAGEVLGMTPGKDLTLGTFNGDYANNHLTAQASGTWTDKGALVGP